MVKKISFNIKNLRTIQALDNLIKATGEEQTAILNKILDEYFDAQKSGFEVGKPIKDSIRKISLLLLSEHPNIQAINREVEVLLCLTSQL